MEKDKLNNDKDEKRTRKNVNDEYNSAKTNSFVSSKSNISQDTLTPISGTSTLTSAAFAPEFRAITENRISNALYKISETNEKMGHMAGQSVKSTATMLIQQTGDSGRGFKTAMDVANVAGISASMLASSINRQAEKSTLKRKGIDGLKSADAKLGEIDAGLKACGLEGIPKDKAGNYIKGNKLEKHLKRQKVKAGGLIDKQASELVKSYLKQGDFIAQNTKYLQGKGNLRKIKRLSKRYTRRALLGSGDSGRGLQQVIMITGAAKTALKANIKVVRMSTKASRFAFKKSLKLSLKLATKVSNTKSVNGTKLGDKLNNVVDKGNRAENLINDKKRAYKDYKKQKGDKKLQRKNKIKKGIKKGSNAICNKTIGKTPVDRLLQKARQKIRNSYRRIRSSKIGNAVTTIFSKGLNVFRFISKPFAFVKSIIHKIAGFLIGLILLPILFYLLSMLLMASIGLTIGDTESTTSIARDTLNDLYKADLQWIQEQGENYSNVEVVWKDIKDYDLYNSKKTESNIKNDDFSFSQSSNCAEILSMAQVHFNYALDDADPNEVKDYVTKLYYGSHRPIVTESSYTKKIKNKDGKTTEETVTSAVITMETTYFPKLFDCQLLTESQNNDAIVNNSSDLLVCSVDDIYIFLRENGYSHAAACGILGNMAQESGGQTIDGINPNIDQPGCLGICSWSAKDSPGRVNALKKLAKDTKKDYLSLELQLSFLMQELNGPYSSVKNKIQKSDDVVYCTEEFEKGFEAAGTPNMEARIRCAMVADDRYKAYKDDWSKLTNSGKKLAQYASSFAEKIHYTQGLSGYIGSRYIGPDLSSITTDKVGRNKGTDCSGFIASVYMHYGMSVPQSTSSYSSYSSNVIDIKDIQPGDVLWISNHVEMYIGNGQTMGLHDQYCVTEGTKKCNKDSNISQNGLDWFKKHSDLKVYRFWK